MVTTPEFADSVLPLLTCLEDGSSPPEDKTDAYLRLAEDLAKEDKQFVQEVCNCSARLLCVMRRDMSSKKNDLSQAALQAIGYCLYQEQIVSSLQENDMSKIIQDLCDLIGNSVDKNLCTRALWSIGKQNLSATVIEEKLPVILKTVQHALITSASTTVEMEALEVIYRLITQLPNKLITLTAGQWSKLVYPLLISSAHKIREKALGVLELGVKPIILAREDVVTTLMADLKGGMLSELTKFFADKKEIFVLRTWTILITILGETLHKSGSLINDMLKIPEQGFKSTSPDVQSMSYSAWISLIDNFAISPNFIGSLRKIKLLMMPLLLSTGKVIHKDIELGRLQAWWHLVCAVKTKCAGHIFSEVCVPLLHYFFNVNIEPCTTPLGHSKDGMQEFTMPVTPVAGKQTNHVVSASPATAKPKANHLCRKTVVFYKTKFSDTFVKQVMLLGCEILMEILAVDKKEIMNSKRLTEHLEAPILQSTFSQDNELFILAVVKSALCSCANHLEDSVALSIWTNMINRIVAMLQSGDPKEIDDVMAPLFFAAYELLTSSVLSPTLVLKFLDVLTKLPTKYLLHPFDVLSSVCSQGKPLFLLADILFSLLTSFKGSYVDERFHIVFESLVDAGLEASSAKLANVNNVWLSVEGLMSSIANVEDMWRFWSKVICSVSDIATKTSDVNQGDSLEHDFTLMISLISFPFKQLFTGGMPGATIKELDRDLAEFFRLFSRCASIVPTAEANTCIEELSNSLLAVVSQEKCKNTRFLDGICNLISVMIDCVDFSAENLILLPTSTSARGGSLKLKTGRTLGNLDGLVALSAKVLSVSYAVDKGSSGSIVVAPAVMVLVGALSKFFTHLTSAQYIKETIAVLSEPLASFISHYQASFHVASECRSTEKKYFNAKFFVKIDKLWTDILTCLQSRYTAAFDSELLEAMSELLESTFCHPRRQFKNQTIMFWNATFAHIDHLDYPASLRTCLQTVLEKTHLNLPGWDNTNTKVPYCDSPETLQDSEEMTPKDNIIKPQVVMVNSPKRKHVSSSPGKLKGGFLHKALSADKNPDGVSPFKNNVENSASKRKSPASANVRRKLPLQSLDSADDKDFVVIAPSPKKKRLLTEHQKELRKTKKLESGHPPLYNMLDQSQDGTQFSEWSQTLNSQNLKIIEEAMDVEMAQLQVADKELNKEVESVQIPINPVANDVLDKITNNVKFSECVNDDEKRDNGHELTVEKVLSCIMDTNLDSDSSSPEFIPSSQTPRSVSMRQNLNKLSVRSPFQSIVTKNTLPGFCSGVSIGSEGQPKDADSTNSENSDTQDVQARDESSKIAENKGSPLHYGNKRNTRLTKASPISSRTRRKSKSFDYTPKTKAKSVVSLVASLPEPVRGINDEVADDNSSQISSNTEDESSDQQLDDMQILEEAPINNFSKSVFDEGTGIASSRTLTTTNGAPSSPVTNSSVKFVNSKNACVSSPLRLPCRGFSSPAASPTTGILKRNKGKVDTPSPPGKTRHVSFAFPLREEKEIISESLQEELVDEEEEQGQASAEVTSNFTLIKTTPTKSSTKTSCPEDCIFPDLIDCPTPVEQILPSLATSRWSRGLGHLVHAQNIRTVGNLSALSVDQVEKLPIRSPKVSTLRRVLRIFHETRVSRSPKVVQQREIKEVSQEEGNQALTADTAVSIDEESNFFTDERSDGKKSTSNTEITASSEEMVAIPTNDDDVSVGQLETEAEVGSADVSGLPGNLLTPRRSRCLVKPTTLFVSESREVEGQSLQIEISNVDTSEDLQLLNHVVVETNSDCKSTAVENVEEKQKSDSGICASEDSSEAGKPLNDDTRMDVETTIPVQNTAATFTTAVTDLVSLKTEDELDELPLDTLFTCHEQLSGVLSSIMSTIKRRSTNKSC